jgi:hypothetical protein
MPHIRCRQLAAVAQVADVCTDTVLRVKDTSCWTFRSLCAKARSVQCHVNIPCNCRRTCMCMSWLSLPSSPLCCRLGFVGLATGSIVSVQGSRVASNLLSDLLQVNMTPFAALMPATCTAWHVHILWWCMGSGDNCLRDCLSFQDSCCWRACRGVAPHQRIAATTECGGWSAQHST